MLNEMQYADLLQLATFREFVSGISPDVNLPNT